VPRKTWDAKEIIKDPKTIQTHIAKAFSILSEDSSVTNFGIAASLNGEIPPIGLIDRSDFPAIINSYRGYEEETETTFKEERTKVAVLKIVFERGPRKWQFVWKWNKNISAN